jgi:hypothetical protein
MSPNAGCGWMPGRLPILTAIQDALVPGPPTSTSGDGQPTLTIGTAVTSASRTTRPSPLGVLVSPHRATVRRPRGHWGTASRPRRHWSSASSSSTPPSSATRRSVRGGSLIRNATPASAAASRATRPDQSMNVRPRASTVIDSGRVPSPSLTHAQNLSLAGQRAHPSTAQL